MSLLQTPVRCQRRAAVACSVLEIATREDRDFFFGAWACSGISWSTSTEESIDISCGGMASGSMCEHERHERPRAGELQQAVPDQLAARPCSLA